MAGSAGPLKTARTDALARIKELLSLYTGQTNNSAFRCERAFATADHQLTISEPARKAYKDALARLRTLQKDVKDWTLTTAAKGRTDIEEQVAILEDNRQQLNQMLDAWNKTEKAKQASAQKSRTEKQQVRSRETAVYRTALTPAVLANWLYDRDGLVAKHDPSVPEDRPVMVTSTNFLWPAEAQVEWSLGQPSAWCSNRDVQDPTAACWDRYKAACPSVQDLSRKMRNSFASTSSGTVNAKKLPVVGGCGDTLEHMEWIPQAFKDAKVAPEDLRGCGGPWLLCGKPGSCRAGFNTWPLNGFAGLLQVSSGTVVVACWPAAALLERGVELPAQQSFLWQELTDKDFARWAEHDTVRFCTLQKGQTCWIPFGWYAAMLTKESRFGQSDVIWQPVLHMQMASWAARSWRAVYQAYSEQVRRFLEKGTSCWGLIGQDLLVWIQDCLARGPAAEEVDWIQQAVEDNEQDPSMKAPKPLTEVRPLANTASLPGDSERVQDPELEKKEELDSAKQEEEASEGGSDGEEADEGADGREKDFPDFEIKSQTETVLDPAASASVAGTQGPAAQAAPVQSQTTLDLMMGLEGQAESAATTCPGQPAMA